MKELSLFSLRISCGERRELLAAAAELLDRGGVIASANPEILARASESERMRAALRGALLIPDGIGVSFAARFFGIRTERLPGVELGEELIDIKGVRLAAVGGREGIAERALSYLEKRHRLVMGVLAIDGYSHSDEEISDLIEKSSAMLVYLCLGSPRQELLADELSKKHRGVLFIALGGSLDIYSGAKKRCPKPLRALRLEWAYRMIREPKRLLRLPLIVKFFKKTLILAVKRRKTEEKLPKTY